MKFLIELVDFVISILGVGIFASMGAFYYIGKEAGSRKKSEIT